MSNPQTSSNDHAAELTKGLLAEIFKGDIRKSVGIRLWDGTNWPDNDPRPSVIVFKHPGALRSMLLPGTELGLGEGIPGYEEETRLQYSGGLNEESDLGLDLLPE